MKLSKETLDVLNCVRNINAGSPVQGIVFKKGSVVMARKYKSTMPIIVAEVAETFEEDFAVYDLKKFLSMYSLLDDPDLSLKDGYAHFKSGKRRSKIKCAAPQLIEKPEFFDSVVTMPTPDLSLEISSADWKSINTAAASFVAPELALISENGKVILTTYNSADPKSDQFSIEVGETDGDFTLIMSRDYLHLPNVDLKVNISYRGLVEFSTSNMKYYVTVSEKSKVG